MVLSSTTALRAMSVTVCSEKTDQRSNYPNGRRPILVGVFSLVERHKNGGQTSRRPGTGPKKRMRPTFMPWSDIAFFKLPKTVPA